jgi:hypothetical protein
VLWVNSNMSSKTGILAEEDGDSLVQPHLCHFIRRLLVIGDGFQEGARPHHGDADRDDEL